MLMVLDLDSLQTSIFVHFIFSLYYFSHITANEYSVTTDSQRVLGLLPVQIFLCIYWSLSYLPKTCEMWRLLYLCWVLEPMLNCSYCYMCLENSVICLMDASASHEFLHLFRKTCQEDMAWLIKRKHHN